MSEREVPGAGASGAGVAAGVQVMGAADAARVDAAVELRGVRFAYGEHAVLDGLSLALPAGCLTGIVGPNGCGKSTLLRVIDGVLEPAAGEALVEGDALDSLSARERAERIALLPQIHRTPSMTVEALVSCGRYAHMGLFGGLTDQDRLIVAESMRVAGVEHLAHKAARALSGGERQRAFIAMVLAQRARTVLLDEPMTYLDPRAALDVMGLARGLVHEQGMTGAVVIHDLPLALRFCDRIAVMDSGRIVAVGTPAEILDQGVLEQVFGVMIARMELNGEVVYSCC
ncbi:ABC transporter ATP-binding protein [Collinsella aerofaciens]|uniref:Fe(3+) dicitrate transport ATP-binding protein FecE n=1 Tax=Collinsella aerofaciens TaxID=74426 RepID=A0A5K1J7P8_9ACTN|nr:ABC transporter ATP-binding protein [Collinsella aerofaciens]VWL99365.1 Fe(3+) dicitrate transport ATP-binding protein FecE [Collinsella aerofaciens]